MPWHHSLGRDWMQQSVSTLLLGITSKLSCKGVSSCNVHQTKGPKRVSLRKNLPTYHAVPLGSENCDIWIDSYDLLVLTKSIIRNCLGSPRPLREILDPPLIMDPRSQLWPGRGSNHEPLTCRAACQQETNFGSEWRSISKYLSQRMLLILYSAKILLRDKDTSVGKILDY